MGFIVQLKNPAGMAREKRQKQKAAKGAAFKRIRFHFFFFYTADSLTTL